MKMTDPEFRTEGEEFGFYIFALIPRKCRNGKWRWLTWVEKHGFGKNATYTLGNRAY